MEDIKMYRRIRNFMDRLKKVIEDELKNLDVEERNLLRRTAL